MSIEKQILLQLSQLQTTVSLALTLSGKEVFTIEEAAIYAGRSVRTIRQLVSERKIPYSKPDKYISIKRKDLEAWMLTNPVKSSDQVEMEANKYFHGRKKNGVVKN